MLVFFLSTYVRGQGLVEIGWFSYFSLVRFTDGCQGSYTYATGVWEVS